MKNLFTLLTAVIVIPFFTYAQSSFSDDFESYTVGIALGPQSPDWRTWAGAGGGADDANVVTTDNHTSGGSKSIYFSSTSGTGGPQDVVLPFTASSPLTTGQFSFTTWFKVPTGKSAYFNFQGNSTMGNMYVLDCYMTAGAVNIQNSGTIVASGAHPFGAWFELTINANLNTNSWELLINGVSQGTWSNANNQVWGIDYYPADASASFWIDDVSYNHTPYTLPALNGAVTNITNINGIAGQQKNVMVQVKNLGTTAISSFDLALNYNGINLTQPVTGVNIASLATMNVEINTPVILVAGSNNIIATIDNVNGASSDNDASDDSKTITLNPLVPAAGKLVIGEEGTGTWCQWCTRGHVFMEIMAKEYPGFFQGIAVHNNDPMVVSSYDTWMSGQISGYPSGLINRDNETDPSGFEQYFLQRVVEVPAALLENTATYDEATGNLNVNIKTTFQTNVTGTWKLACVLVEDSVTGTTSAYNQSNAYAGGGQGVMGGYEALPNPVPASKMVYNDVARAIMPDPAGTTLSSGISSGDVFETSFNFTLAPEWSAKDISIVGLLIDNTGKIDNGSSTTISQATGTVINTKGTASLNIYPNPASSIAFINLNIETRSDVTLFVRNLMGQVVMQRTYGDMNGEFLFPVNTQNLSKGLYLIEIQTGAEIYTSKLIIE